MGINANEPRNAVTIGARGAEEVTDLVGRASTAAYCRDDETVQFMLVGKGDGLARGSDDWETTQEPGPDSGVVVLVTDRQTIFVVGECRDPEVDGDYVRRVEHADVDDVGVESSLLSSAAELVLTTGDGVRLATTMGSTDGLSEVTRYLERAGMRWSGAPAVFDAVAEEAKAIREAFARGDPQDAKRRKRSMLESVSSLETTSSIHHVDLEALDRDIERARERLADAMSVGYWRRTERMVEEADSERESGNLVAAAEGYREACETFDAMTSNVETGPDPFADVEAAAELAPDHIGEALLGRLETCAQLADEADDVADSVSTREAVLDGYDAVQMATKIDGDAVDADREEVRSRLREAARRTALAYVDAAEKLEERGDAALEEGRDDEGRGEYEKAIDALGECDHLARRFDDVVDENTVAAVRERLEDKIAKTGWNWGGA